MFKTSLFSTLLLLLLAPQSNTSNIILHSEENRLMYVLWLQQKFTNLSSATDYDVDKIAMMREQAKIVHILNKQQIHQNRHYVSLFAKKKESEIYLKKTVKPQALAQWKNHLIKVFKKILPTNNNDPFKLQEIVNLGNNDFR